MVNYVNQTEFENRFKEIMAAQSDIENLEDNILKAVDTNSSFLEVC